MMRMLVFALAILAMPGTAIAATCGDWISQTNGTAWRVCTDAQTGLRFCELKSAGTLKRIVCP